MWNCFRFTHHHHHQLIQSAHRHYQYHNVNNRTNYRYCIVALGAALGLATTSTIVMADKPNSQTQSVSPLPSNSFDTPPRKSYKYIICGGGVAAQEALKVFIKEKQSSDVLLVTPEWRAQPLCSSTSPSNPKIDSIQQQQQEDHTPGKSLWNLLPFSSYLSSSNSECKADIVIGKHVTSIDTSNRKIVLDNDEANKISFDKILIAVGVVPPTLPVGRVISTDAHSLGLVGDITNWNKIMKKIENSASSPHFTIVGTGNWFATISAMKLIKLGCSVTVVHSDPCFMARCLPKYAAVDIRNRLDWLAQRMNQFNHIDLLAYSVVRFVIARPSMKNEQSNIFSNTTAVPVMSANENININNKYEDKEIDKTKDVLQQKEDAELNINQSTAPTATADIASTTTHSATDNKNNSHEAEVHVGSVFDAFSIVDFRTDCILFVPTTNTMFPTNLKINDIAKIENKNTISTNKQLSAASDIYVAGSSNGENDWSEEYARQTGIQAAKNMMGAREGWGWEHGIKISEIKLDDISLNIKMLGNINGSMESFGYFDDGRRIEKVDKDQIEHDMCGGRYQKGAIFCVQGAKPRYRGDSLRMKIQGIALWNGAIHKNDSFENESNILDRGKEILNMEPMTRSQLEKTMDEYVTNYIRISQFENENENENKISRRPSVGVIWKRHLPERKVPLREEELLWVNDGWVGAASPISKGDEKARAYEELLRNSTRQGQAGARPL